MKIAATISGRLATFVAEQTLAATPAAVRERAKLLMLDAIGNAYAATRFPFARVALDALATLGAGDSVVIGMNARLALRDAATVNGVLMHGLDYDDTYLPGSVHLAASCVPTALGVGAQLHATGEELLAACLLGLEIDARLAAAANGGFVRAGFHATSIAGTFAAALVAGRLMKLDADRLVMAQGIALSTASGNLQPMQDGSWTKRMHPGWAAACGITAATLARAGYVGPSEAYEGRFGLYPCFLGQHASSADVGAIARDLCERWEFPRTSVKLFPACHQLHAFMNAGIELFRRRNMAPDDIDTVRALVAEAAVPLVCEPAHAKRRPATSYAAQFSLHYAIACALTRGRFGLQEIEEASYTDPGLLRLAQRVEYAIDPDSGFPKYRSGEVIVTLKSGEVLSRRENILPDEPASAEEIMAKFLRNVEGRLERTQAQRLMDRVMSLEALPDARALAQDLA